MPDTVQWTELQHTITEHVQGLILSNELNLQHFIIEYMYVAHGLTQFIELDLSSVRLVTTLWNDPILTWLILGTVVLWAVSERRDELTPSITRSQRLPTNGTKVNYNTVNWTGSLIDIFLVCSRWCLIFWSKSYRYNILVANRNDVIDIFVASQKDVL